MRGFNLGWLGVIQGLRLGAGFAVNVLVMRGLGVEGYGIHGYVTTLVAMGSFASTMGLDRLLKREMAREPTSGPVWVSSALWLSGGLSGLTVALLTAWAWAADGRPEVVLAATLAAFGLGLQGLAAVPVAYFHAIREMRLGVNPSAAGRATLIAATAGFLGIGWGVVAVFAAQVCDAIVNVGLSFWTYARVGGKLVHVPAWRVRALLSDTIPFGVNGLFASVYLSSDVLVLAHFHDDAEVGTYRAAVAIVAVFPLFAETFSSGVFPRMATHLGDDVKVRAELAFVVRIMLLLSVPAAVGGMLVAEDLLVFISGPEFAGSALPFMVMAPLLPLRFVNNGYSMTLTALNRQPERTRGVMGAALGNLALNLVVLQYVGAVGAALTTLLTELGLAVYLRGRIGDLGPRVWGPLARVGVAAGGMGAVVWGLAGAPVLLRVVLGGVVFVGAARAVGAWDRGDLRTLRTV